MIRLLSVQLEPAEDQPRRQKDLVLPASFAISPVRVVDLKLGPEVFRDVVLKRRI